MISLISKRLILRPLSVQDAMHFYNLNTDPDVLKYTGDLPFESIDAAATFLKNYDQYTKYRVGRMAVILKETGEFIGWCGLKFDPTTLQYDLGFRFFKIHWNQGYATEAALSCIEYAFKDLDLTKIIGRAMQENAASIRVLENIGFKRKGQCCIGGKQALLFENEKK